MRRTNDSSSYGRIDIEASARRLQVDNRFSLRYYFRVADNILKQADIFREEKNIIDLYVMLLRFSSLVSETIPFHREYRAYPLTQKNYLRNKLLSSVNELEKLKPAVAQKVNELNQKHAQERNNWSYNHQNNSSEWTPLGKKSTSTYHVMKAVKPLAQTYVKQGSRTQQVFQTRPVEEQFGRISINFPRPKEETLSKHSILGPQGLHGQWQPPRNNIRVCYPSNIDWTPVEIPSLQQSVGSGLTVVKQSGNTDFEIPLQSVKIEVKEVSDCSNSGPECQSLESILTTSSDNQKSRSEEPSSLISFETDETPVHIDIVRQPSPPAVLAEVQDLVPSMSSQVTEAENKIDISSPDSLVHAEPPLQLHISTKMMDSFMKLAKSNTKMNLETCGVLAGSLKDRKFYITALIIPKQEATANSCQATHEEEIFDVQDKRSLFPLGWIHTHPTQSCFMSSIDVHTHYSYQVMLPEAVAIVMAPTDTSRKHGIFRLTTPGGMSVIRHCQLRGFHSHDPPPDGGPLYETCTEVYMNPSLNFDVIDLR